MPAAGTPTILLDLLSLFYDENVRLPEASRLLGESLRHLRRLSAHAPMAISVQAPPPAQADRLALVAQLQNSLEEDGCYSLVFEEPVPQPPLRLF
jgi:hypothetical protein